MTRRRVTREGLLDGMVNRRQTDFSLHAGSNVLVYLVHGVTGTPAEMYFLARELAKKNGWDIYATTLPGHCARLKDLVRTTEQDWRAHVQHQLSFARDRYEYLFVAGLSAGALLALEASTIIRTDGIGVLSPTFVYDGWNTPWSHTLLPLAMKTVPLPLQRFLFHRDGPPFGIKDEALRSVVREAYSPVAILRDWIHDFRARWTSNSDGAAPSTSASKGYPIFPLRTLSEIERLIAWVRARLRTVTAPTVILQAREDDMTGPRNASIVFDEISSPEKQLILLDDCYHVITVDKQKEEVARSLTAFFGRQAAGQGERAVRQRSGYARPLIALEE
ncbi:MAG TPA: alpha/beta fold hydrolase [Nitrospira sp.]|nr:alpha/beta fold hydrolase [Nitrospira sp.]